MYQQITIKTLHKQGKTNAEIAEMLGCHRHTVENVLKLDGVKETQKREKPSSFDTYHTQIATYRKSGITIKRIWEMLQEEYSIQEKYQALCKYVQAKFEKPKPAYIVQTTDPGEEVEIDFGYLGLVSSIK